MDKQFLEFWGNMMLAAAKGQQQLDDIMKWFSGSFGEFKDITAMFCKMYGIEPESLKSTGFPQVWQKSFAEFQRSFGELAIMMDLVPRKEYIELSRENQELKKRIAALEEGNAHLRSLLAEKVTAPAAEGLKGFQDLINDQAKQYQDFMKNLGDVFEAKNAVAEAKAQPKPAAAASDKTAPKAPSTASKTAKAAKKSR